ncbi:MAG: DegT/DnrJ/EryC1/StrS family aminotransferase, partial [Planctomycetes bacterium]|nr:DegT/DnrJ/EryC1/StrS family aminotransferase [Planctomycetota bacterium]
AVQSFETELAEMIGVPYAAAVSSGTDALVAALQALGVGPGDEVLTTPFTFFATVASIVRLGAKPVFVDIDAETCGLKPERVYDYVDDGVINGKKFSEHQSEHTKVRAIVPVHLYGQCCDMDPILELADQFSLMVVEDAAQAILARYKDTPAGALGDAGCFSFYPSKNLGALGEGGAVVTRDEGVIEQIRQIRNHGQSEANVHPIVGGNYRLNALTCATLRVKLRHLMDWTQQRAEAAATYNSLFEEQQLLDDVILPRVARDRVHNWHQYVIRVDKREELRAHLVEQGVGVQVYYPIPAHLQASMKHLGYAPGDLPEAERTAAEVLSLPLFPGIQYDQQEYVVSSIKDFFETHR